MNTQPPAFQFYSDNFLQGTCDMTQAEVGAYIRLLCKQWNSGKIPNEKARAEFVAGGPVSEYVLLKFKKGEDGEYRNERMERERRKQVEFREKQSQFGKTGGRPKKGFEKGSLLEPLTQNKGSEKANQSPPISVSVSVSDLQSSPPSPLSDSKLQTPSNPADTPPRRRGPRRATPALACASFDQFWAQYPRKEARAKAEAAWTNHGCADKLQLILMKIREAKPRWITGEPNFIPLPASWLNGKRWEDELSPTQPHKNQTPEDDKYRKQYGW